MSARSNTLIGTSSNVEHFEQLSRERDALLQSAKQADREREHALARLQELRATQKMLSNHVHVAQETLGVVHRENTMWKNEQARLQQVFQQERKEIQQCVDEGNELRAGETQRKRDFCKKTETLNDELGDLLMQQEDIRSQKMITVESVPVLLEYFQTITVESEDRNGCDTQAGAQALADLQAAISDLTNATGSFRDEMSRKKRLEALVQQLRARALQQMSSSKDGAPQQVRVWTTIEQHQKKGTREYKMLIDSHTNLHFSFSCIDIFISVSYRLFPRQVSSSWKASGNRAGTTKVTDSRPASRRPALETMVVMVPEAIPFIFSFSTATPTMPTLHPSWIHTLLICPLTPRSLLLEGASVRMR
jgi:hypothetical protein